MIAIIQRANRCGVSPIGAEPLLQPYAEALACDPVSAFGGIIATNRTLDAATAEAIAKLFVEVIIAPALDACGQRAILAPCKGALRHARRQRRCPTRQRPG